MSHRPPFSTLPPFWRGVCEGMVYGTAVGWAAMLIAWLVGWIP